MFENFVDKECKLLNWDMPRGFSNEADFKLEDMEAKPDGSIVEKLLDSNPEFMEFLFKKHIEKNQSNERIREKIERKIHEESEFIEQEFQEFIERKRIFRLQYFQEAILEK